MEPIDKPVKTAKHRKYKCRSCEIKPKIIYFMVDRKTFCYGCILDSGYQDGVESRLNNEL